MRGFYFIIIFSSYFFLIGCNYHLAKQTTPAADSGALGDQTTVDAIVVQQSVLITCVRCHSGAQAPKIENGDDIRNNIAGIQNEVNSNQMPPASSGYSSLTSCQKAILQEWVAEGMPTKSEKKVGSLPACQQGLPAPSVPKSILEMPNNYQTLTTQILQPRCLHCHNSNSSDPDAADYLLFPFSKLTAHRNLLGTDSLHSKFFNIVSRKDSERMPPPEDSESLSKDELEFIRRWINAGHPEN